jgi:hypothetical protein
MAALSGITAVRPMANTIVDKVPYGATIAAGQPLYQDSADGEWKLGDADASLATAKVTALAITPGVDNGHGLIAKGGSVILVGTTMVVGRTYYLGPTAGEIVEAADVATADYVTVIGTAATATQLDLAITPSGILKA